MMQHSLSPIPFDAELEFRWAREDFDARRYTSAARRLERVVQEPMDHRHGLADVRELLARSYYHSAQLAHAEDATRAILADHPSDAYAMMLLTRILQRQGRSDEARGMALVAEAMGVDLS